MHEMNDRRQDIWILMRPEKSMYKSITEASQEANYDVNKNIIPIIGSRCAT